MQKRESYNYKLRLALLLFFVIAAVTAKAQSEVVYATFTATDGTENDASEGYKKLVDGKYSPGNFTKWNTSWTGFPAGESRDMAYHYVDFHADAPIPVTKYILTTGDDIVGKTDCNPKSWILKAKQNENDEWTTIATVVDDTRLQYENYANFEYAVDVPGAYQFFRLMITPNAGSSVGIQLGELRFVGNYDSTDLAYTSVEGIRPHYLYTGNDIDISYILKTHDGTVLTDADYTVSITKDVFSATSVNATGTYKLAFEGKGNYRGWRTVTFEVSDKVEISGKNVQDNYYLPTVASDGFPHTLSQQIYTADEIGIGSAGYINSIAFCNTSSERTRNIDIYMVNTSRSSFASNTDWVRVTAANKVFSGDVTFSEKAWTTIQLSSSFLYDGQSNLLLIVDDNTGASDVFNEKSCLFQVYDASGQTLHYSDYSTNPNPAAPGGISGDIMDKKNVIRLGITPTYVPFVPIPTGLTCTAVTAGTATLEWTNNARSWEVCLNDDEEHLKYVWDPTVILTGLIEDNPYYAKVRAIDMYGNRGCWSEMVTFVPTDKTLLPADLGYATTDCLPLNADFKNNLTQQIYTASELGKAAAIKSIDFYCTRDVDHERSIDIYMVSTDKSSFDSKADWIAVSDADRVFHGSVTLTEGWNTFLLTNPFNYDGDSNVAIMVDDHSENNQSKVSFRAYDAPAQAIRFCSDAYNFDPTNPLTEASSNNVLEGRKNQLRILKDTPPFCPKPTALAFSNVTAHGATLSWESDASAWQVCVNGDETHLIDVTEKSYSLSDLDAETAYTAKVRAVCGPNDVSAWSKEVSATTAVACPAPTALSITNLTDHTATLNWADEGGEYNVRYSKVISANTFFSHHFNNGFPSGWTTIDSDGDGHNWTTVNQYAIDNNSPWYNNQGHNGSDALCSLSYLNGSDLETDNWLITPQVTLKGMMNFYVSSLVAGTLGYGPNSDWYEVYVSTGSASNLSSFVLVQESRPAPVGLWDEITISLKEYEGQTGYVAIRHHSTGKGVLAVDDLTISEYVYNDWTTQNGITANSINLDNLYANSIYQWLVQKVCGGIDGSSKWAEGVFTTTGSNFSPADLSVSYVKPTSVSLNWKSDASHWKLCINDNEKKLIDIGQNNVSISYGFVVYKLDGLDPSHFYNVRVISVNDNSSVSQWSENVTFTTPDLPQPTGLAASEIGLYNATLEWTANSEAAQWAVAYKADGEENFTENIITVTVVEGEPLSPVYSLTGLDEETQYIVKVSPVVAGDYRRWSDEITFTTREIRVPDNVSVITTPTAATISWTPCGDSYNLQYRAPEANRNIISSENFEDKCQWNKMSCGSDTKIVSDSPHGGAKAFKFTHSDWNPSQHLVSPELTNVAGGTILEFYYRNSEEGDTQTFKVGYDKGSSGWFNFDTYTYGNEISVSDSQWHRFREVIPMGTEKISLLYTSTIRSSLFIDDIVIFQYATEWTTISTGEPTVTIASLTPNTTYEYRVQGVVCEVNSDWTPVVSFNTLGENPVPLDVAVSGVTASSATVSWRGYGDSYNVRYREPDAKASIVLSQGFENGFNGWTRNGYGRWTDIYTGASLPVHSGSSIFRFCYLSNDNTKMTTPQYLISPKLADWTDGDELKLEFYYNYCDKEAETFYVGYSATGTADADFTFGNAISGSGQGWRVFYQDIPVGTKYICLKYTSNNSNLAIDDITVYKAAAWVTASATESPVTITSLIPATTYECQVQSVKDSETSGWSASATFTTFNGLELADDDSGKPNGEKNADLISDVDGLAKNVMLAGRMLYKDGDWNTLCLPFAVNITTAPLAGDDVVAMTLDNTTSGLSGTTLTLNFNAVSTTGEQAGLIPAGTPFIIKWASKESPAANLENPVFNGVTINKATNNVTSTDGKVTFIGTYNYMDFTSEDKSILFLGAENTLYWPLAGATIGAQRAYFQLSDGATVREFKLNFGDEDSNTTRIDVVDNGQWRMDNSSDAWYTLDGRKLNGEPTKKGMYIVNGNKVVVK